MINYFAHAEELHSSNSESIKHLLELWYSAIPIYLFAFTIVAMLTYYISRKSISAVYIVSSAFLLISGVLLYDLSPVVSTIAIVVGLFSSMAITFLGIGKKK